MVRPGCMTGSDAVRTAWHRHGDFFSTTWGPNSVHARVTACDGYPPQRRKGGGGAFFGAFELSAEPRSTKLRAGKKVRSPERQASRDGKKRNWVYLTRVRFFLPGYQRQMRGRHLSRGKQGAR